MEESVYKIIRGGYRNKGAVYNPKNASGCGLKADQDAFLIICSGPQRHSLAFGGSFRMAKPWCYIISRHIAIIVRIINLRPTNINGMFISQTMMPAILLFAGRGIPATSEITHLIICATPGPPLESPTGISLIPFLWSCNTFDAPPQMLYNCDV